MPGETIISAISGSLRIGFRPVSKNLLIRASSSSISTGFLNEVDDLEVNALYSVMNGPVPRQDDHRKLGLDLTNARQRLDAVHAREA
jgi:hypothetical protein